MNTQKSLKLKANSRDIKGKKVKQIRQNGLIPAVVYDNKANSQVISVDKKEFIAVFKEAGSSALVDLTVDDKKPNKVIIHEPQLDPIYGDPIHIDFYKVRMDEKIKTEIPIKITGQSEAVESLDGSLVTNRGSIEVECLPSDLVSEIEVDISPLKTFEDQVTVADIKIPQGMEVLTDTEEVIALVEEPRSEEELEELEETSAAEEEQEAIEKMQAEGAEIPEGEEGEAAEGEEAPAEDENQPQENQS